MTGYNEISQSIAALRAESSPQSVTPERVGALLQAITDLINALRLVPDTDVADVMQMIQNAVSTAQAANNTAQSANANANNKLIAAVSFDADMNGVTFTIKQAGHNAITVSLPAATGTQGGVLLPSMLSDIASLIDAAAGGSVTQLLLEDLSEGLRFGIKKASGATLQKTFWLATTTANGIMSKEDKAKLDALPSSGAVGLDAAGRVPAAKAPVMMLRRAGWAEYDTNPLNAGDFFVDGTPMHIYYCKTASQYIDLGVPSKNVIYCETETNVLYRWTGTEFVPALTDPNYAMQEVEVRRNNTTQKIYTVPNGKLAKMIVNTVDVNVQLTAATAGASVHRMIFSADSFDLCENINWPSGLVWKNGTVPTANDVDSNYGIMVTIYGRKWAEFNTYSE